MTDFQGSGSQTKPIGRTAVANAAGLPDNFAAKAREAIDLVKGWKGDLPSLLEALRRQRTAGVTTHSPEPTVTRPSLFSDLSDEALRQLMSRQPTTWKIG